jgi:hypothetical protein
LNEKR